EVVPGSHGDAGVITKALAGADRLFWLVPPPPFGHPGSAERYYLDFTRYRQVAVADRQAAMLRRGASQAMAQAMADMTEAQNNGIYDAEPRGPDSAAATSFRQWCHDTLKPAVQP
ncbi:MAG TPA: hypothetical protein VME19_19505, partial [Streptosporangiaceae bacterium]|nr:hypothetical protein [Streptosporangiaceae bacterium]